MIIIFKKIFNVKSVNLSEFTNLRYSVVRVRSGNAHDRNLRHGFGHPSDSPGKQR